MKKTSVLFIVLSLFPPVIYAVPVVSSITVTANTTTGLAVTYTVSDSVIEAIDWRGGGITYTAANLQAMPSIGWKDYGISGYAVFTSGATLESTGGSDGNGDYLFDGSNDYSGINHTQARNIDTTISCWVSTTVKDEGISQWSWNNYAQTDFTDRGFYVDAAGHAGLYVYGGTADPANHRVVGTTDITDGQWHLITGYWNTTSKKIYVDGQLEGSSAYGCYTGIGAMAFLTLGFLSAATQTTPGHAYFSGKMENFEVYNRILSDNQIAYLYDHNYTNVDEGEVSVDQYWCAFVTGNNGTVDGNTNTGCASVVENTATWTPTSTATPTYTPTFTITQTVTETVTETVTPTYTPTVTDTITPTITETVTPTVTQTVTETVTQTVTPTFTPTVTRTVTPTQTPWPYLKAGYVDPHYTGPKFRWVDRVLNILRNKNK